MVSNSFELCPTVSCSTNWAGYAVTGAAGSVSQVEGSWVIPSVTCPKKGSTYAALWAGIDGYGSDTVEQTGILIQCSNGKATYSAWYEFYPAASYILTGFTISKGQKISVKVSYSTTTGLFTTTITNENTQQSYSTSAAVSGAKRSSAEWITERPEVCSTTTCELTTLSNFGTADYGYDYTSVSNTNYATVGSQTGQISSFSSEVAISMVSSSSSKASTLARPSALSSDGTSFSMKYH